MRTTLSIPDDLFREARRVAGSESFSAFARRAIAERVRRLRREQLARKMEEGYRAEATDSSLPAEWAVPEVESWP